MPATTNNLIEAGRDQDSVFARKRRVFGLLQHILQSTDARLRDDLGELRKYHLLALGGEAPAGGARLEVPGAIQLMRDIIKRLGWLG